nr:MAG TPA: hypothetical protein [Caudoviricetes sp.]
MDKGQDKRPFIRGEHVKLSKFSVFVGGCFANIISLL